MRGWRAADSRRPVKTNRVGDRPPKADRRMGPRASPAWGSPGDPNAPECPCRYCFALSDGIDALRDAIASGLPTEAARADVARLGQAVDRAHGLRTRSYP